MPTAGTQAYGTGESVEGVVVSEQDAQQALNPLASIAKDIHAIEERYCLAPGLYAVQVSLAQNAALKIDLSQRQFNALLFTVNAGILFYWFGDFTNVNGVAQTLSHGVVSAGVIPQSQQIVLPPGNYVITLQANGGAASGYVTAMAL